METLYSSHLHALQAAAVKGALAGNGGNVSVQSIGAPWTTQGGLVALGVVLGSSISLVGLAFSFITYSLFSDLRSLAGTTLLSLLASLFMGQLLFVIGVGGVQDVELCIAISLALLFMKLATFCWLCCCCHNALTVFRNSANVFLRPEGKMGRTFVQYSVLSWGFPLLMVAVAAAFKYKEHEHDNHVQLIDPLVITALNPDHNCWLMKGTAYTWGFLLPAIVLWCTALYLACHAKKVAKISAGMQVDARVRSKLAKRRCLQINLFVRMLMVFGAISLCGAIASIWNVSQFWSLYSIGQGMQGIITTLLVTCNCKILKLYTTPRLHKSRKGNKYAELQDGGIGGGGSGGGVGIGHGFGSDSNHYAVMSVTNPNYTLDEQGIVINHNTCTGVDCVESGDCGCDDEDEDDDRDVNDAGDDGDEDDEEVNVFGHYQHRLVAGNQQQQRHQNMANSGGAVGYSQSLARMGCNEDLMCDAAPGERSPLCDRPVPQPQQMTMLPPQIGHSAAFGVRSVVFDRLVVDSLPVKDLMDGPVPQPV